MKSNRDLYLAAYDITEPSRLRGALELVKGYAVGGQKSMYECFLSPAERKSLLHAMTRLLDTEEDAFMLIRLDPRATMHALGVAVVPEDPPFFYCA